LWRRFHATNAGEVVVTPGAGNADKPERDCWCCNCGRKGHVLDNCRSYSYSKYPPSSVRVVNYDQPKIGFDDYIPIQSKKARREEKILLRREKKMLLKKSKTCPNSPAPISFSKANFNSEPSSPTVRESAFPTSLLVEKAIKKLDKEKSSKKKWHEQNKNKKSVLSEIINSSTFKAEVGESDNNNVDKSRKRGKAVNSLIKACNESKKFNRMKEWKEKRGFGKKEASNTSKAPANEEITVPRSIKAACKFLKKEMQRKFDGSAVSEFGRKIKKDLKEEIFGLRNMHTEPTLNKKKRKRLANLVLEVRNCP